MNLRRRLLLSHVLPLLISVPLVGLLLISAIEDRVIVPNLTWQVEEQARIISRLLEYAPETWDSPLSAQTFVERYASDAPWRLMLVRSDGIILASNSEDDRPRYGQVIREPEVLQDLQEDGTIVLQYDYSLSLQSRVIDYWMLITDGDQVQGILRISQPLADVLDTFAELRSTVITFLLAGLLLGTLIALGLATTMEQPLEQLVHAMDTMSSGDTPGPVQTSGPEELQLLARAFNSLVDRLEHEAGIRKQLLANLVHELGRPLGALHSAIQALASGADQNPELKAELLEGMEIQTLGLQRLVEDLTQLYERGRGTPKIERVLTDLNQWFHSSTQAWQSLAEEKGLGWHARTQHLPSLEIDPVRLGQAWGNLLSNAIKFTEPGGEICVEAEIQNDEVRFSVNDSGPGLSVEDQEKIFVPFFRSNRGHRFPQGMGLGLSIAEELVNAHRGYIKFHSEIGKGSTFTICLPLERSKQQRPPDTDAA